MHHIIRSVLRRHSGSERKTQLPGSTSQSNSFGQAHFIFTTTLTVNCDSTLSKASMQKTRTIRAEELQASAEGHIDHFVAFGEGRARCQSVDERIQMGILLLAFWHLLCQLHDAGAHAKARRLVVEPNAQSLHRVNAERLNQCAVRRGSERRKHD